MTTMSPPMSPQHHPHEMARPERPRATTAMSHASTSSRRSRGSNKLDLTESAKDKKRFTEESKADPTKALNEATPGEIALQHSNLEDLRTIQHKDTEGNVITDPDRSNPTRPRLERPLDTIRSFNAAAEGTSSRRSSSYGKPASQYNGSEAGHGRNGSYYSQSSGYGYGPAPRGPSRQQNGGYYRNHSNGYGAHQHSFDENAEYGYHNGNNHYQPQPPRPGYGMRNGYPPSNSYQGGHPNDQGMSAHSHQQSYETMTSGSEEYGAGRSTNPSSLNSSMDQLQTQHPHARKPQHDNANNYSYENAYAEDMNFAPVSPVSPQMPPQPWSQPNGSGGNSPNHYNNGNGYSNGYGGGYHQQQQQYNGPAPPVKDYNDSRGARQPMRLDSGPPAAPSAGTANNTLKKMDSNAGKEKRQSWLSRKFSRREKS